MPETKLCCLCHIEKLVDDFSWRNKAKGWRNSECKACRKKQNHDYYHNGRGKALHIQKYLETREERHAYFKAYYQKNKPERKYDPVKAPARRAVARAIRNGNLIRPNVCNKCGTTCKPQAHHHNGYDKQHYLDVIWLCTGCHALVENPEFAELMEKTNVISKSYPHR